MCKNESEKKKKYNLSKAKYMVVKTGKEKEEDIFKEHSTNQEIRILRNHNKWRRKSKRANWRMKTKVWDIKQGNRDSSIK